MTSRNFEELFDEALRSGQIPADAPPETRSELERLMGVATGVKQLRTVVDAEASASMPAAKARLQRTMAASQVAAAQPISAAPREGLITRLFGRHRVLALAASATAIGIIALAITFGVQSFGGVETASALTLNENDFAQVEGVVSAASDQNVTVQSDFGEIQVAVSDATTAGDGKAAAQLVPGDVVMVAGTVSKKARVTSIAAVTLAVAPKSDTKPDKATLHELRDLGSALEGRISVVTVSGDGKTARVLIDAGAGEHVVVRVGAESLRRLLSATGSPIGTRVRVSHEASNARGEFSLTVVRPPSAPAPVAAPTGLSTFRGVMLSRQANIIRLQTERGVVSVVVGPKTRIVVGKAAGLTVAGVRDGVTAVGHEITVQGALDRGTGHVLAEVLVVGAKSPR